MCRGKLAVMTIVTASGIPISIIEKVWGERSASESEVFSQNFGEGMYVRHWVS